MAFCKLRRDGRNLVDNVLVGCCWKEGYEIGSNIENADEC